VCGLPGVQGLIVCLGDAWNLIGSVHVECWERWDCGWGVKNGK